MSVENCAKEVNECTSARAVFSLNKPESKIFWEYIVIQILQVNIHVFLVA